MSQNDVAAMPDLRFPAEPAHVPPVLRSGYLAIKKFWRGFVLIQACCVAIAFAYYYWPAMRDVLDIAARWKDNAGWIAIGFLPALAGGILPELVKAAVVPVRIPVRQRLADGVFYSAFYFMTGFLTVWLYNYQVTLFGEGKDWATVAKKILFDQLVWTPTLGCTLMPIAQAWRAASYRLMPTLRQLKPSFYYERIVPVLLPNWCYWFVMCAAIYAMPSSLQFIQFLLAAASWSLLVTYMTRTAAMQGAARQKPVTVAAA